MEIACANSKEALLTTAVQAGSEDGNDGERGKTSTFAPSIWEDVERGVLVATSPGRAKLGCRSFECCLCSEQPDSKGSCSSLDLHEPLRPFVCMNLATLCGRFVAQDSASSAHRTAAGTIFALVWIFHGWQRLARLGNPGGGRRMKASFRNSGWGIRVHVGTIRDSSGFIRSKRRSRNRCIRFLSFGCIFLCQ
jgi:hypothetical protein